MMPSYKDTVSQKEYDDIQYPPQNRRTVVITNPRQPPHFTVEHGPGTALIIALTLT